jgi:hypothetical protein
MSNVTNELTGFGQHTAEEVQEIQKALSIGSNTYGNTLPGSMTGGTALSVESLDRTLKVATNMLSHLVLWKDIAKEQVDQVINQYNVLNQYGKEVSPFFAMGSTPTGTDAGYARDYFQVKYLGTKGSVTHDLTKIRAAHGAVVAEQVMNKTIELLSRNERAMVEASSSINFLEYDGIDAQIRTKGSASKYIAQGWVGYNETGVDASPVKDIRSGSSASDLDQDILEDAGLRALNNFGMPGNYKMFLATDAHSRYSRSFYLSQRTMPGSSQPSGYYTPDFRGSLHYDFKPSTFLRPRKEVLATAVSASSAPTIASLASPVNAASQFASGDAGTYSYRVSAVFADGETLASSQSTVTVSAGDGVTIDISYSGSPLYFNIFRAPVGTTTGHKFIGRIAATTSGATYTVDLNAKLPGSSSAYLLDMSPNVVAWKQLGSMIKYDLAVTTTAYEWLQLLYGSPLVTLPRFNVIIDNIA